MSATKTSALDQLLLDLFTTAIEGGISYWAGTAVYHWSNEDGTEDHQGFYALISYEAVQDDTDGSDTRRVDRSVMAKGYRLATTTWPNKLNWSSGDRPPLVVGPDTDWDFDADDADMILQLGLFDAVVYG